MIAEHHKELVANAFMNTGNQMSKSIKEILSKIAWKPIERFEMRAERLNLDDGNDLSFFLGGSPLKCIGVW